MAERPEQTLVSVEVAETDLPLHNLTKFPSKIGSSIDLKVQNCSYLFFLNFGAKSLRQSVWEVWIRVKWLSDSKCHVCQGPRSSAQADLGGMENCLPARLWTDL